MVLYLSHQLSFRDKGLRKFSALPILHLVHPRMHITWFLSICYCTVNKSYSALLQNHLKIPSECVACYTVFEMIGKLHLWCLTCNLTLTHHVSTGSCSLQGTLMHMWTSPSWNMRGMKRSTQKDMCSMMPYMDYTIWTPYKFLGGLCRRFKWAVHRCHAAWRGQVHQEVYLIFMQTHMRTNPTPENKRRLHISLIWCQPQLSGFFSVSSTGTANYLPGESGLFGDSSFPVVGSKSSSPFWSSNSSWLLFSDFWGKLSAILSLRFKSGASSIGSFLPLTAQCID